jgi:hydroxyethylthiazole kinase-like uncharacterized protein yjeF
VVEPSVKSVRGKRSVCSSIVQLAHLSGGMKTQGTETMTELLTAAQMRAIEHAAIASGEVTGLELMERAGQGVVDAIFKEWPELRRVGETHRAVVLCGPGNNGGDGFVVARLLKVAGWEVDVFLYGDAEKLPPDARVNYERWIDVGKVKLWSLDEFDLLEKVDLLIDAIYGIGLSRALPADVVDGFNVLNGQTRPPYSRRYRKCVSIDLPTGICANSGKFFGRAVHGDLWATLTVTFLMAKVGHYLADAAALCGKVIVKPLGLHREEFLEYTEFGEPEDDRRVALLDQHVYGGPSPFLTGRLKKYYSWHKYSHGHALILSGGVGQGGAARLAARGALRIGAGAVTVACPPAALIENAAQLNAVMLRAINDAGVLTEALKDTRINALCIGPAFGIGDREKEFLSTALEITRPGPDPKPQRRGLVLDADALTLLAQNKTLFAQLHKNCILTPHAGEFARLFPDISEKLAAPATKGPAYSKVDATRDAAARAGCTVLFKGPDTVIAGPDGRCSINASVYERSAPWLATAGSGDVLAGFITGLLARGFAPMQAAETGAWLHTECALSFGPGLIAEDLPDELPKVFRALGV